MGFFDTKYYLVGGLQTSRLLDKNKKRDLMRDAIVGQIRQQNMDCTFISPKRQTNPITAGIYDATINNLYTKSLQMLRYAEKTHPDGVVTIAGGDTLLNSIVNPELYAEQVNKIEKILEEQLQRPVEVVEYQYNTLLNSTVYNIQIANTDGFVVHNIPPDRGFQENTFPFYHSYGDTLIENWEYGIIQPLDYYGEPDGDPIDVPQYVEPGETYNHGGQDFAAGNYGYELEVNNNDDSWLPYKPFDVNSTELSVADWEPRGDGRYIAQWEYKIVVDNSNYLGKSDNFWHQVIYRFTDTNEHFQWAYHQDDNTYPEIHLSENFASNDTIFPRIYIADQNEYVWLGELGQDYKENTIKLAKYIDIDLDLLHDSLVPSGRSDENFDKVEDAFVDYSADLGSDSHDELAYIYQFFRLAYLDPSGNVGRASVGTRRTQIYIAWKRIQMFLRTGNVDTWNTMPTLEGSHTVVDQDSSWNPKLVTNPNDPQGPKIGRMATQWVLNSPTIENDIERHYDSVYVIRRQISETQFVEIAVEGYWRSDIFYEQVDGRRQQAVVWNDIGTIDQENCLVPLTTVTMGSFSKAQAAGIVYDSLRFTVRATDVIVQKWYEQTGFWDFVSGILFVVSLGTSSAWEQGFQAFIREFVIKLIIARLVLELLLIVIDLIGGDIALIIAAAAAVIAGIQGDTEFFELITAEDMMFLATTMVAAVNTWTQDELADIQRELEEIEEAYDTALKEIEEYEKQIGNNDGDWELWMLNRKKHRPDVNESPSDFYYRSIHLTNPGVLSLDTIDTFVCNKLKLPKATTKLALKEETELDKERR